MEVESHQVVLSIFGITKNPGGESRNSIGSVQLSPEIPEVEIGRRHVLLSPFKQLARHLLRLRLGKDKKIEVTWVRKKF
jgi:hypothetical protein